MNYYKLETVTAVLRTEFGANCVSVAAPRREAWERVVGAHTYRAWIAWHRGEEILSEIEVQLVADALRIKGADLIRRVRSRGGLWLGPATD